MSERKKRLLASKTKLVETVEIEVEGQKEKFDVRSISVGAKLALQEKARAAGDVDADGTPTSTRGQLNLAARLVVASIYEPGTLAPAFVEADIAELIDSTFFEDLTERVGKLLSPDGAKGKSTAAASTQPEPPSPSPSTDSPTK